MSGTRKKIQRSALPSNRLTALLAILLSAFVAGPASIAAQETATPQAARTIEVPGGALISYQLRPTTTIEMRGTGRMPQAYASFKVRGRGGVYELDISNRDLRNLQPPWALGLDFHTYILWAVSPEGRATNLGEIRYENGSPKGLKATVAKQVFWLMITAEPHFAVLEPSPAVVLVSYSQDEVNTGNKGMALTGRAVYRTHYTDYATQRAASLMPGIPLYILQARKAVKLANQALPNTGQGDSPEETQARAALGRAHAHLHEAEQLHQADGDRDDINLFARTAAQYAESARALALGAAGDLAFRRHEQRIQAAEEEMEQHRATIAKTNRDLTRARDQITQLEAAIDLERRHTRDTEGQLLALREQVSLQESQILGAQRQLQEQQVFNQQLCTALGIHLSAVGRLSERSNEWLFTLASDTLFDSGKFDLRPAARKELAKVAVLRTLLFPGASVRYEGHTDLEGEEDYNQWLSEQRALSIYRFFLEETIALTEAPEQRAALEQTLSDVETMLKMSFRAVRRQPRRRQEWLDSLNGVVAGKGEREPLVSDPDENAANRRVNLIFPKTPGGGLATLCRAQIIPEPTEP